MSEYLPYHSFIRKTGFFPVLLLLFSLGIIIMTGYADAEKIPVTISIGTVPQVPIPDQAFHITGTILSGSGEPLGNKRVTLEKSANGADSSESFSFLAIVETSKSGTYEFYRPAGTPPEFLRVRFAGNDQYSPALSSVIQARGAGTNSTQARQVQTGSITVTTNPAGADVYIDSLYRGISPVMAGGLAEGSHILEIAKPGYQNETMEGYVIPSRGSSFSITLNQGGRGISTGLSSSVSFSRNLTDSRGEPVFSLGTGGMSMDLYASSENRTNSSDGYQVIIKKVSDDPVNCT